MDSGKRDRVGTTMVTPDGVTSGYLFKLSSSKDASSKAATPTWKLRFFILIGNVLSCYMDHEHIATNKGEIFIFEETVHNEFSEKGKPFGLILKHPFEPVSLAAISQADQSIWKAAFTRAVEVAKQAPKGYVVKISSAEKNAKKLRYCFLHENVVSFHTNQDNHSNASSLLYLEPDVVVDANDTRQLISITERTGVTINIVFVPLAIRNPNDTRPYADYNQWKDGILDRLVKVRLRAGTTAKQSSTKETAVVGDDAQVVAVSAEADDEEDTSHQNSSVILTEESGPVFKEGVLGMRPPNGGEYHSWPRCLFRLRETSLVALKESESGEQTVFRKYLLSPSSSAFETNLGENTFELVSSNQILHVCAESPEELASWIYNIRRAVSCAMFDVTDPLFQHALLKIDNDIIYEAHFPTKQPLGVIFERSGDWAITKTSSKQEVTNITVGSVLSSINGESVVTSDYFSTVNKLRGWNPPLTLTFRAVPRKEDYLLKDSRSKSNPNKRVWKKRYFILSEGKLAYKDKHTDAVARVELPLMGSGVALVDPKRIGGKNHVFKVLSGVVSILIQCSSHRQMMDWASTLFHAIAIANGGSYVIDYEVDRFLAEFIDIDAEEANLDVEQPLRYRRLCESAKRKLFIAVQSEQRSRIENVLAIIKQLPINEDGTDALTRSLIEDISTAEALFEKLKDIAPNEGSEVAASSEDTQIAIEVSSASVDVADVELHLESGAGASNVDAYPARTESIEDEPLPAPSTKYAADLQLAADENTTKLDSVQAKAEAEAVVAEALAPVSMLLEKDRAEIAKTRLAEVLASIDVSSIQVAEEAIEKAKVVEEAIEKAIAANVEEVVIEDARMELIGLRNVGLPVSLSAASSTAEFSTTVTDAAPRLPPKPDMANLLREKAQLMLQRAMATPSKANYRNLCSACLIARKRGVDGSLVSEAEAVLIDLRKRLHDEVAAALTAAEISNDLSLIENAINDALSVDFSGTLLDSVRGRFNSMTSDQAKKKLTVRLIDGIRLKNATTLQAVITAAAELGMQADPAFVLAADLLKLLLEKSKLLEAQDLTGLELNREQVAEAANKALQTLNANRRKSTVEIIKAQEDDDDEDDVLEVTGEDDVQEGPKRRQNRGDDSIEAKFQLIWKRQVAKSGQATINAMQFSGSYRLITGDKGNLYREMQMFKRFDIHNNGALTEEDWIDGWMGMIKGAEFAKTLSRVHELVDRLAKTP